MTQKNRRPTTTSAAKKSGAPKPGTPVDTSKAGPQGAKAAPKAGTQSAAQKRLAAQRAMAAASGAQSARRKRLMTFVGGPIIAVIVIVAIIVVIGVTHTSKSSVDHTPVAAPAALQSQLTSIPASVFDTVGTGSGVQAPTKLTGAALTAGSLPRVLYVGAEWCPYCAAERWAVTAALSRFGTLSGLQTTYSSSSDVDANTPTLTFATATYTSTTIDASLNEIQDGNHNTIKTLAAADETLFTSKGQGSFPFIDIGGKFMISGASYDPAVLKGKTYTEIATAMADPTSTIAKAVDGTANYISAAICASTNDQPSAVCSSTGVKAAATSLGLGS